MDIKSAKSISEKEADILIDHIESNAVENAYIMIDHIESNAVENASTILKFDGMPALTDNEFDTCLLYTSPSPRDISGSRMPSSA